MGTKVSGILLCLLLILCNLRSANVFSQEDKQNEVSPPQEAVNNPEIPVENIVPPAVTSIPENAPALGAEEAANGVKLEKEKISLDLKGVDLVELFRILSQKMGITIVPTKSVTGRANVYLNNLTFNDALDVILVSQDLASERKGDIINIMTSAEYERLYGKKFNEKRKFTSVKLRYAKPATVFNVISQIKSDIGKIIVDESTGTILVIDIPEKTKLIEDTISSLDKPPDTQIFDIRYAKPADLKSQLSTAITSGTGELLVDERSNKLVISDLPEKMKKIKRLVKALDEPAQQVFIEAEIVQITLRKEYLRGGINWEKVFSRAIDGLDFKGTFPLAGTFTPSPLITAANLTMSVGSLTSDKYTATMQFLETFGDIKVLSRPRITVLNNQEAKVMVGSREAYVSQSQSQSDVTTITSENIQFIDVGVKLNVVPQINKEGFITMKIKPEVSSVRETLTTALKSTVPIVETSEAETTVKIKDGTMILIAGLMKEEKRNATTGLPVLAKIPIIGALFGSRESQNKKTELIIFLTPHITTGEAAVQDSEPEKLIPEDIMPEDMKEDFRRKKELELKKSQAKPAAFTLAQDKTLKGMKEMKEIEKPKALSQAKAPKEIEKPKEANIPQASKELKEVEEMEKLKIQPKEPKKEEVKKAQPEVKELIRESAPLEENVEADIQDKLKGIKE